METCSPSASRRDIAQALAGYDAARKFKPKRRDFEHMQLTRPKFKPLVLSVLPTASVHRVGGTFECFVGGEHVQCRGEHTTPDRAWLCLARFIAAGAST